MITANDLMIVRAALQFWSEEMCPHVEDVMRPYFERAEVEPLSAREVQSLRRQLDPTILRYAAYDAVGDRLADTELFMDAEEAIQSS